MSQYAPVAQRTLATIQKKGAIATFREQGDGDPTTDDYDPLTDTFDVPAGTSFTAAAVKVRSDPVRLQSLGLIIATPITLLVAAQGTQKPAPLMTVAFGGYNAVVRNVEDVAPLGQVDPILYIVDAEL